MGMEYKGEGKGKMNLGTDMVANTMFHKHNLIFE